MPHERQHGQADHLQKNQLEEEVRSLQLEAEDNGLYHAVHKMAEKFAATRIGQFAIEHSDRLLHMIEETAKWSLPEDKLDQKLVRPFNWFTFLSLILVMRLIRMGLSVGSLLIGNSPITASDVVYFLQTRRRKLRAIRVNGLKEIQRREEEANALKYTNTGCFTSRISALLSIAICRPGHHRDPGHRVFIRHGSAHECGEEEAEEEEEIKKPSAKSIPADKCPEEILTVDELLSKYADEDSADDSDYLPNPEEEEESDSDDPNSTSSSDSRSVSEERQDEVNTAKEASAPTVMSYKDFSLQHQRIEDKEPTTPLESTKTQIRSNKSMLNESVEIHENGDHHEDKMPQPLLELKQEVLSDTENASKQKQTSVKKSLQPSNGNDEAKLESDPQPPQKSINARQMNDEANRTSASDHVNASKPKAKATPGLGTTAAAASRNEDNPNTTRSLSHPILLPPASLPSPFSPLCRSLQDSDSSLSRTLTAATVKIMALSPATPSTPTTTTDSCTIAQSLSPRPRPRSEPLALSKPKTTLTSSSSTEDLFYSPIGSPPDFDVCFNSTSILKSSTTSATEVLNTAFAQSSDQINPGDSINSVTDDSLRPPVPPKKQTHHHPHSNKNRSRGKNRR